MKQAIISDIHSNLEAFQAVLADMDAQGVDEVYCLGDLIGYGPNPKECVDLAMKPETKIKVCIMGNHDYAAVYEPSGFNSVAEQAIYWTRTQLEEARDRKKEERLDFVSGQLKRAHREGDFLFVHGSPKNPTCEYVFKEDVRDSKMEKLFGLVPHCCFMGHTHVPGVFTCDTAPETVFPYDFLSLEQLPDRRYEIGADKVMVNVGSVGQPRDHDPRACYAILHDGDLLEFRRVPYDIEKTFEKIIKIPELDDFLGERLKQGR
ncbi:MAG: metallophosphoesterase family protein [Thermoguttaceae bacterium]|nr:metallophosphoesterase family protein [Thermoguttaceae bacterium]